MWERTYTQEGNNECAFHRGHITELQCIAASLNSYSEKYIRASIQMLVCTLEMILNSAPAETWERTLDAG